MISLATLVIRETKAAILAKGLQIAQMIGLPVTSWQPGDETRSIYHYMAEVLDGLESNVSDYIKAGFLDWCASDPDLYDWLVLLAKQLYNYDAQAATYASGQIALLNAEARYFEFDAGDITFKNSSTGKTYHNTSGGVLAVGPGTTLTLDIEADEAGSESSAGVGDIDEITTSLLGVTCGNTVSLIGVDEESSSSIVAGCRAKLGSLSPNGPADAYSYVVTNESLTSTTAITKVKVVGDSATGAVTIYVAGPSGAVAGGDVLKAQAAVEQWATPLCITPTVASASGVAVAVTYQLWIYSSVGVESADIQTAVAAELQTLFASQPIGGDVLTPPNGNLYKSLIEATILKTYPDHAFRVSVSAPAGDTALTPSQVATLGTITPTITLVNS